MKNNRFPIFPDFEKLNLNHKAEYERIVSGRPPYSDYNFMSLWSYNIEDDCAVSMLGGNLVIKFRDYITNKPFYSFLGRENLYDTINTLLDHAQTNGLEPHLKLIPEHNLKQNIKLLKNHYRIRPDRDNFDYVFSLEKLNSLPGKSFNNKRNKVSRFIRDYPGIEARQIDLSEPANHKHLLYVFSHWSKGKEEADTLHENKALKRLLRSTKYFKLMCVGIYIDDRLKAFTIAEIIDHKFSIAHFTKADPKCTGIFEFLYKSVAGALIEKGCLYFNREQDLGLEGLRQAKLSWRPIKFLKKYIITHKN